MLWAMKLSKIVGRLSIGAVLCGSATAWAQSPSHAYINSMRSSYETHYFVSIGADALFGSIETKEPSLKRGADEIVTTRWQGYGVRNEIGIEFLKFLQFGIAHTSLNLRSKNDSTENLSGSRFEGNGSLNFYAPLGNLQIGGGMLGSRLDLRNADLSSDYYGSGYFYNAGYNYFMNSMISIYLDARRSTENMVKNSGQSELPKNLKSNFTEVGLGFKIWL